MGLNRKNEFQLKYGELTGIDENGNKIVYSAGGGGSTPNISEVLSEGNDSGSNSLILGTGSSFTAFGDSNLKGEVYISGAIFESLVDETRMETNGGEFDIVTGNISIEVENGTFKITGLPTEDPVNAGALWDDNGTLRISSGV